jgi:hypothetical protein
MARDLQGSELSPLCANVLGESGPPGEMLNRGGHLIRSRLDLTSRLDPTIRCLRTGGARLGGYALAPVDTRGKKANRFFHF